MKNKAIWEARYKKRSGVPSWPFDLIISLAFRYFGGDDKVRREQRILDYGCGSGNNYWFLIKEGFDAYACDISADALVLAKDKLRVENLNVADDHFSLLEGPRLPYEDDFFSGIIDRESLCQSSWSEILSRVSEFKRVLKPGGIYIGINFTCMHPDIKDASYVGNGDWTNFQTGLFKGQGSRHLFSTGDIYECFGSFKLIEFSNLTIHSLIGSSLATSEFIVVAQKI